MLSRWKRGFVHVDFIMKTLVSGDNMNLIAPP